MSTSEAMMDELRTDLCELGFMELIDYVHEFLPQTAANMIAIKQLNRMWRFIAMMAAHWEGAIFCKCGKHMLLNPTKLQKPNAKKDAWCCDLENCGDFCTCNIPKCLKNDDEMQEQRIGGYPAFEYLAIDFGICHENELDLCSVDVLRKRQPNIDNVYFDSWPQDDVVAIRFIGGNELNDDKEINNKLLERFGPRNLRLFVAANAPLSPTSLEKCGKLKSFDLFNAGEHVNGEAMSAVVKLAQLKRLSLDWCKKIPQESFKLLRDNKCIENLSLEEIANDAIVEEVSHMQSLVSLSLSFSNDVSSSGIANLVTNATRLESLSVDWCRELTPADIANIANISTLRCLGLHSYNIRDSNIEEFATKLPQLEVLELWCDDLGDNGFATLGKFRSLRSLRMQSVPDTISPDVFNAALGNLTQLRVLDLNGSGVKSEHLQFLEKLRNLEVLSLESCDNIDDEGLSHLRFLSKLRKLDLDDCEGITSGGIAHLSQLTEMESLDLSFTYIDDKALQHISGMNKMRWLKLSSCESITEEGLKFLREMTKLESLNLRGCVKLAPAVAGIIRCVEKKNSLKFLLHSCDNEGNEVIRAKYPHVQLVGEDDA